MSPLCSLAAPWEIGQPAVECYGLMLAFSPDSKLEYSLRNFLAFTSSESWGLVVGYTPKSKRSVFKVVAALGLMPHTRTPTPTHTHALGPPSRETSGVVLVEFERDFGYTQVSSLLLWLYSVSRAVRCAVDN